MPHSVSFTVPLTVSVKAAAKQSTYDWFTCAGQQLLVQMEACEVNNHSTPVSGKWLQPPQEQQQRQEQQQSEEGPPDSSKTDGDIT